MKRIYQYSIIIRPSVAVAQPATLSVRNKLSPCNRVFYTVMILFQTLLNRNMWANPISNVIGVWGLHTVKNGEIILTTEVPENLALFIPFTILLLWTYCDKIIGEEVRLTRVLWQSTKIVFIFSFTIEFLQLFLRLGTWQLSDLFYNTLGGFIGGFIYWIGYRIKHRKS